MASMSNQGGPAPYEAQDAAEFIEAMRRLKDESGLTYRQLEDKAAAQGATLARSTLANALSGRSLPRPELLAAFVRACGGSEHQAAEWTRARSLLADRIRTEQQRPDQHTATAGAPAATPAPQPPTSRRPTVLRGVRRAPLVLGVALAAVVLAAVAARTLTSSGGGRADQPAPGPSLPSGPVQIHPAGAPDLCLTEGEVPDGRYHSVVAVQKSCDEVAPQETTLVAAGGSLYRIQWFHPDHGKGCLKAWHSGPAAGLLEPLDDCAAATRLHIEQATGHGSDTYVFRAEGGRGCLTIRSGSTAEGTEAVLTPCTADDAEKSQRFHVEAAPATTPRPSDG